MKGISNVVTTSALILIALVLLAIVIPWAWMAMTQVTDTMQQSASTQEKAILSDFFIIPPPAENPSDENQVVLVLNNGSVSVTGVKVELIDTNFNVYDLNLYIIRKDGSRGWGEEINLFEPGDVIIAKVPARSSYLGYKILVQSNEYSEAYTIGG